MDEAAENIIDIYNRHAGTWDRNRWRNLFERPWLDRFMALVPEGGSILDIGCGAGDPIARHFIEAGYELTGADAAPAMIALCRTRFPDRTWVEADMRALSLGRAFNGVLAWDSFFHLTPDDQRRMFPIFGRHAAAGAALMFTSGPRFGVGMGSYQGEPLYHASLAPEEYQVLLDAEGFDVVSYVAEDRKCGGRTIWLARRR